VGKRNPTNSPAHKKPGQSIKILFFGESQVQKRMNIARKLPSGLIFFFCLWLCPGCVPESGNPGAPELYADVFVRYLFPDQAYKVQVSFMEGDSLANAEPTTMEGAVTFQGRDLDLKQLSDQLIRYEWEGQEAYESEMLVHFVAPGKRAVDVPLTMPAISGITISETILRGQPFRLSVAPGSLAEDEILVLLFSDLNNQAASLTIEGPKNLQDLQVPSFDLQKLAPGTGRVYGVRKKDQDTQINGMDVRWSVEFYTDEQPVNIQ